jgi:hypothetical protein
MLRPKLNLYIYIIKGGIGGKTIFGLLFWGIPMFQKEEVMGQSK